MCVCMCVCVWEQVPQSADGTHEPRGIMFAWGWSVVEVLSLERATYKLNTAIFSFFFEYMQLFATLKNWRKHF